MTNPSSLFFRTILVATWMACSLLGEAQRQPVRPVRRGVIQKKDSLQLSCPLTQAMVEREKGEVDQKIILSSKTDTALKACFSGRVSTIQQDEEGKWEVVFNHQDYWFWYTGIGRVTVKKNQELKSGDVLGIIQPGDKIELLIYDFETPVDPAKYLRCD